MDLFFNMICLSISTSATRLLYCSLVGVAVPCAEYVRRICPTSSNQFPSELSSVIGIVRDMKYARRVAVSVNSKGVKEDIRFESFV